MTNNDAFFRDSSGAILLKDDTQYKMILAKRAEDKRKRELEMRMERLEKSVEGMTGLLQQILSRIQ